MGQRKWALLKSSNLFMYLRSKRTFPRNVTRVQGAGIRPPAGPTRSASPPPCTAHLSAQLVQTGTSPEA